ncbi:MAG: phosphoribosylamine--glycine ligase [bacterium]
MIKRILITGSGGREHALAWKLGQSPGVEKIFIAPGNAGTARLGENVAISPEDVPGLLAFAKSNAIDFTVVGPDDALAAGVVDAFEEAGLKIFGPRQAAARLESSKAFAKDFMIRHGIPTADYREFTDSAAARDYCRSAKYPLVVKADGLALGKGVIIAANFAEADAALRLCMEDRAFGDAGSRVVIEEFLEGVECSIHALVDGSRYLLFPDCRDHKKAHDGDQGPNTGGMGTISPSGSVDDALRACIRTEILDRFIAGIQKDNLDFRGMLFPGLMLTPSGPKVLEFNCRWGDPETQVLVRRLESDLLPLLEATASGALGTQSPAWDDQSAVCVILASGGYPGSYEKGKAITGLAEAASLDGVEIFHAGTKASDANILTNGGRVLGVTAKAPTLEAARSLAYQASDRISFEGVQRRNDIGATPTSR